MVLSLSWTTSDVIEAETADYEVILEFSRVLRLFELYKEKNLDITERFYMTIEMFLITPIEKIPTEDYGPIIDQLVTMIIGDKPSESNVEMDMKGNVLEEEKQFYDFEEDSAYIYASFMQDYGINLILEREKAAYYWERFNNGKISLDRFKKLTMSWDKFSALLIGLSDNTKFRRVIEIRQMEIPKDATTKEREDIQTAKRSVALKSDREQIEFEMMDLKEQREFMRRKGEEENGK